MLEAIPLPAELQGGLKLLLNDKNERKILPSGLIKFFSAQKSCLGLDPEKPQVLLTGVGEVIADQP